MEVEEIIPAVSGVVGAVIGSGLSWIGESIRTRESRLFDRRVRQLDEVVALADAIDAMRSSPNSSDQDFERDLVSWENGHLAALSLEANRLIEKAERYSCDVEVNDSLIGLYRWCNDGAIEVAKGHSLMRQQENHPDVDLKEILPFYLWLVKLQTEAQYCVNAAKKCLREDEPTPWRKWGAFALSVLLVAVVVMPVIIL